MGPFMMVVLIVLIATIGKVAQSLFARPSQDEAFGVGDRVRALESELRANELRLAETEDTVARLNEKLRFVEQLLEPPKEDARLPPPRDGSA